MNSKKKAPKFGDAWKNNKSDPAEIDNLFSKFVKQPAKADLPLDQQIENTNLDQPKDQQPQENTRISTLAETATLAVSAEPPLQTARVANSATLAVSARVENIAGFTKLPNTIIYKVLPTLSPTEQVIYLRLYILSHGFGQDTCQIGLPKLASNCNISSRQVSVSIDRLVILGWVKRLGADFGNSNKGLRGNIYQVITPSTLSSTSSQITHVETARVAESATLANNATLAEFATNKEDDHDFKKTDHHQDAHAHATMTLYQKLTNNNWNKADDKSYAKIRHLPIEQIATTMRTVIARATQKPASLAYFVKEILNPTQANPANRETLKKKYCQFLAEIREANVGGKLTLADLVGSLKDRLVRDGLPIDDDLINQSLP